ncbi:MAG: DUF4097 family beta strand repeat-containing protein [Flammeovirgaceae bacterium]
MKKKLIIPIFLAQIIGLQCVFAQRITVQVISKTIEKQFDWSAREEVKVEGEKAKVTVYGWDKSSVKVTLKQISKAPTKEIATKELAYQRYILEKRKGVIHIKNYFAIPKGTHQVEGIQKVEYEIWLPKKSKLTLKNNYGNTSLKNLAGDLHLNTKYGNIILDQYSGNASVKSYFGDLTVNDFAGSLYTDSNHTMTTLSNVAGDVELNSVLGDVIISYSTRITRCKVMANKADVTLNRLDWNQAFIQLSSTYGDLLLPPEQEKNLKKSSSSKMEFKKGDKSQVSHIEIHTSFGKIIIP